MCDGEIDLEACKLCREKLVAAIGFAQHKNSSINMKKSITVGDRVCSPVIEQFEFKAVINYCDGPLSGSVTIGMHSYFCYFVG